MKETKLQHLEDRLIHRLCSIELKAVTSNLKDSRKEQIVTRAHELADQLRKVLHG